MSDKTTSVQRWSRPEAPTEALIRSLFDAEDLQPYRWGNARGDVYSVHAHAYSKVIIVVQGSITFGLPDKEQKIELLAGDRLDLPAGESHDAIVGSQGVVCLEAHR